jgi:oligopeptide transport system permease protein
MAQIVRNEQELDEFLQGYRILDQDYELIDIPTRFDQEEAMPTSSFMHDVWVRFRSNKGAIIGGCVIIFFLIMSFVAPALSQYTFDGVNTAEQSMAPRIPGLTWLSWFNGEGGIRTYTGEYANAYHFFGTDVLGRDLWVRTWEGVRISLFVAGTAVLVNVFIGILYGMISGYFGGMVDNIMQRFQEIVNSIPTLVILTLLLLIMKPGLYTIIVALILTEWIGMARITRAQVLKIKEQEFILASKTLGASGFFIIFKNVLPNIFGQIIIMAMFSIPNAIFYEAFLAMVGLGIPAPQASLGSLINDGFKTILVTPYQVIIPTVVLGILMLSFNLLADGLRDAFDPKMKEM